MKLFGGKHSSQRTGSSRASRAAAGRSDGRQKEKDSGNADAQRTTSKGNGKRRLTGVQRGLLLLLASLAVLALVLFGVYKAMVRPMARPSQPTVSDGEDSDGNSTIKKPSVTYVDEDGNTVEATFEAPGSYVDGVYNILLLGTDDDGTRTDTIMIAHMDTTDHSVALLSIPRDTLVYGNYSIPKINGVYGGDGEEGVERLEEMLATMLGFQVDGYVLVDLQAFVDIINIMGGVTFDVPQRMYYSDPTQGLYIDLYAGEQTLTGEQAMGLVRYRSGYAAADIRRVEVQRDFLKAMAEQLLSLKTITKIQPIVETCLTYVSTDLTLGNMLYFAQELLKCDLGQMESITLPGQGVNLSSGSYYSPYPSQVLEVVNEYFNPYDTDISLSSLHLRTASSSSGSSSSSSGSSGSSSGGSTSGGTTATTEPEEPAEPNPDDPNGAGALDPGTEDPGSTDPGATDPGTTDPGTTDPGETDPDATDPDATDQEPTDPGTTDPGTTDPEPTDPGSTDPGSEDPAVPIEPGGGSSGVDILDPSFDGETSSDTTDPTTEAPAETPTEATVQETAA